MAMEIVLQWIPGHCNIAGNETTDKLAKEGSAMTQKDSNLDIFETRSIIKAAVEKRWKDQHSSYNKNDHYYDLLREDQVIIFRHRCGYNKLKYYMHTKFKISFTPDCRCGGVTEDAHHILQHCPLLLQLRSDIWPEPTTIQRKLYGDLEDLERTATYIKK